ncbi:MAG TPA: CRISPR-associated endonuclease Cas2 [bacterium]|nr:CRISPR-associated endonuclease Cas2 [bacterium]
MLLIISYDITDDKKRTRLAKKLKDFGPRVQKSVFEADVHKQELDKLFSVLSKVELDQDDSIRLYRICSQCAGVIKIWGCGKVTKDADYYIA